MKTTVLFLITFLGITTISCDKEDEVFYHFDESKFIAKQKQWEQQNLKNYKFKQSYNSSTTGPVSETINVRNGIASSENDTHSAMIGTISEIYNRILNDFNEGKQNQQVPIYGITVDVNYNEEYNFPEKVKFSTSYKENIVGGAWYELQISDFEILE